MRSGPHRMSRLGSLPRQISVPPAIYPAWLPNPSTAAGRCGSEANDWGGLGCDRAGGVRRAIPRYKMSKEEQKVLQVRRAPESGSKGPWRDMIERRGGKE
jgi:hypothetical protein